MGATSGQEGMARKTRWMCIIAIENSKLFFSPL